MEILAVIIFIFFILSAMVNKTYVVKCESKSCDFNIAGRCKRRDVQIYDNGVKGICLWHTLPVIERVSEVLAKGKQVGKKMGEITLIDELLKLSEEQRKDLLAISTKDDFKKWMERHGAKECE